MVTRKKSSTAAKSAATPVYDPRASFLDAARQMRRWADTMLGITGSASELQLNLAKARATDPKRQQQLDKAGSMLRKAREAAGMTMQELSQAIEITDPETLKQAEIGQAALPMEVVLRLAGVLGRHDPAPFAMKLARSYNPQLWKALDALGVGSLVALAGRERELANLYRGNDDARRLSDDDFAEVLAFVKNAFDMAVRFRVGAPAAAAKKAAR